MQKQRFSTYDMVIIGVMAAVCFAATYFLKVGPIPTPAGPTMIKLGNAFCLLGGLLFGGMRGGLAAGFGCMFYDLTDPAFVASAPFTLVFYFTTAFVCGTIAHLGGKEGTSFKQNLLAAILGAASYYVLHIGKSIIVLVLAGSTVQAAVVACASKMITSGINGTAGVIVAVLLAPVCRAALIRAGLRGKLFPVHGA